ncbi:AFG1 [Candida pseudojiufengensis]|uniref:AFG1 n=1 Tax=Candida pseudojiufengensis TaxID=497109 RepID=UPI0022248E98|nr:AFG1 [Candida pseudojiufengensis]KAI5965884.1 AFG1 [Candida pseudojiufengensis]
MIISRYIPVRPDIIFKQLNLFIRLNRFQINLNRNYSTTPTENKTPLQLYNERVEQGKLRDDQYQRKIITSLSILHENLVNYKPPEIHIPTEEEFKSSNTSKFSFGKIFSSFFGSNTSSKNLNSNINFENNEEYNSLDNKGIYLYGDVGCGKTMLMDLFYDTIPSNLTKKRVHFHQFMQNLHKRLHQLKLQYRIKNKKGEYHDEIDVIPILASEIAKNSTVLCFDEFQVIDVADAMLLRRLLMLLLSKNYGVILFATSNRAPDDLYLNGIQRVSFIPCIKLIKYKTRIIYLNSPIDYRKIPKPMSSVYYYPKPGVKWNSKINQSNCVKHINQWYEYFNQNNKNHDGSDEKIKNYSLKVWGRQVIVPLSSPPKVAQFTFFELCGTPMSAADYLTLAESFESFIITDIPYLSIDQRNQVRRFITFLDAVYDSHGKLSVTCAAPFKDLFVEPEDLINDNYQLYKQKSDLKNKRNKLNDEEKIQIEKKKKPNDLKSDEDLENFENDELVTKHGFDKNIVKKASMFVNDEEKFAFARALSRLSQMSTTEWIEFDRNN